MIARVFLAFLAVALFFGATPSDAQESVVQTVENHDGQGRLLVTTRYTQTYDAEGNLIDEITSFKESTDTDFWDSTRSIRIYDDQRRPLEIRDYQALKPDWALQDVTTWTYAADSTSVVRTRQRVDASGSLQNSERTTETRDLQGRLRSRIREYWIDGAWQPGTDPANPALRSEWTEVTHADSGSVEVYRQWYFGEWRPGFRFIEYGSDPTVSSDRIRQIWSGSEWLNRTRMVKDIRLQEGRRFVESLAQSWENGQWQPSSRLEEVTYTDTGERTGQVWSWEGSRWEPRSYYTRLDQSATLTSEMQYRMDQGEWVATQRTQLRRDSEGRPILDRRDVLLDGVWLPNQIIRWSYASSTSIEATMPVAADVSFHVSPNPSSGRVTLHLTQDQTETPRLEVFDILGRSVTLTAKWEGSETLDLGGLPPGVYFLRLSSGRSVQTAKVVVR